MDPDSGSRQLLRLDAWFVCDARLLAGDLGVRRAIGVSRVNPLVPWYRQFLCCLWVGSNGDLAARQPVLEIRKKTNRIILRAIGATSRRNRPNEVPLRQGRIHIPWHRADRG